MAKNNTVSLKMKPSVNKLGTPSFLLNIMRCTLIDLASVRKVVENQR